MSTSYVLVCVTVKYDHKYNNHASRVETVHTDVVNQVTNLDQILAIKDQMCDDMLDTVCMQYNTTKTKSNPNPYHIYMIESDDKNSGISSQIVIKDHYMCTVESITFSAIPYEMDVIQKCNTQKEVSHG